jgi:hypothetical protein
MLEELLPYREAPYVKGVEFYCKICDSNKVHSDKPESGKFFSVFGHTWDPKTQNVTEDYEQVIFAVCPECIKGYTNYIQVPLYVPGRYFRWLRGLFRRKVNVAILDTIGDHYLLKDEAGNRYVYPISVVHERRK